AAGAGDHRIDRAAHGAVDGAQRARPDAMKVVLLDRDGVLNEDRADYVKNPGELVLISGVGGAIAHLNAAGIKVAIVSNQSAVGRGIISLGMLEDINSRLLTELRKAGAKVDLFLVCTDAPGQQSERRKPAPG